MLKLNVVLFWRKVRRVTLIVLCCASFLGGLGITQLGWRLDGLVWLGVVASTFLLCWRKVAVLAIPGAVLAGGLLGLWRGSLEHTALYTYTKAIGIKVVVVGTVASDPTFGNKGQRDFHLQHVYLNGRSPPGDVRVTTFSLLDAKRGDIVRAAGKLYEGSGSYQAAIYFADAKVVRESQDPVASLKRSFAASLYSNLPANEASLGIGILVGTKTDLPDDVDTQLKTLSLTHIVVASGYNLTILVRLARRLFERRSKYQTALAASALMIGFVMVTGLSPSMNRAVLVSSLSLVAWYYGRRIHPVALLLVSAAITAGISPTSFWSDIGWWLSFLAFAGVLVLAPLVQRRLYGKREPKLIGQIVIETLAAQALTLPLIITIFGGPSLLSLPANMLVVPLVPLCMLLVFAAGVVGLFLPAIAAYVALPAYWLLGYIVQLVGVLAGVGWAQLPIRMNIVTMLVAYGGIVTLCLLLWRKTRHDFLAKSVIE